MYTHTFEARDFIGKQCVVRMRAILLYNFFI